MTRLQRKVLIVATMLGSGVVFQFLPGSCSQLLVSQALFAFDTCSVLNCEGGSFFNFCEPVAVFVDCPNLVAGTNP